MSNLIDVIETWGRDAQWRHATDEAREAALIQAGFAPEERAALLGTDHGALETLLGATHNICCMINHPEEEEQEPEEEEEDEHEDEEESEDDEDEE
ncbi:MAG TPA: hypothetical protein VGI23_18415 [Steroidobacteraceae bacterium]|jgi:hypothetical protein